MIRRIFFINSLHSDYLEDLLFAGLTEILGADNVVAFPANYHHYFSKYRYPKNLGQCRNPLLFLPDTLTLRQRIKRFDFDAIVLGSTKEDAFRSYLLLEPGLPKGIPLIYVDGGDRPEVGGDAARERFEPLLPEVLRRRKIDLVFKREYASDRTYDPSVFPFPFSFKAGAYSGGPVQKKYQAVFWAVESDPVRSRALELLRDRYDCAANGTAPGQTFRRYARRGRFFLKELASAKISYNFRGVGWDTLRYWEIPGVGSFMISGVPGIRIPENFRHGEHAIFCKDDLSDLLTLTDYYLRHEDEREEIAANGLRHLRQYHTHRKRAEYFLDTANEFLSKTPR